MHIIIALLLFIFFSTILAVLCFRMRKKPSMLNGVKQKWADTASMVPPKRQTPPPAEGAVRRPDTDFEDAMMNLNCADQVGNVFSGSFGSHDD